MHVHKIRNNSLNKEEKTIHKWISKIKLKLLYNKLHGRINIKVKMTLFNKDKFLGSNVEQQLYLFRISFEFQRNRRHKCGVSEGMRCVSRLLWI